MTDTNMEALFQEFESRCSKALSFFAGILAALSGIFLYSQLRELSEISDGDVVRRSCKGILRSKNSSCIPMSAAQTYTKLEILPRQCYNSNVWTGDWDLNKSLVSLSARSPADEDLARRYHSKFETRCNMTDILKFSSREIIAGHVNDAIELSVIDRMKGLRGQSLLQIGTSVDNRLLRHGCPIFGVNRNVYKEGDIAVSECKIPLIDFSIVYSFNDALTKAHMPLEEQQRHWEKIDEVMSKYEIQPPRYIVFSGIEWDMKWHKDENQEIDWNYTEFVVDEKVSLLRQHYYPDVLAFFLRTQPFTTGTQGRLASQESFRLYNDIFYSTVRHHNPNEEICGGVHIADLAEMMINNGTAESGWSDGIHPSGWVSLQFMNILLNVISLIGELC